MNIVKGTRAKEEHLSLKRQCNYLLSYIKAYHMEQLYMVTKEVDVVVHIRSRGPTVAAMIGTHSLITSSKHNSLLTQSPCVMG